MPAKIAKGMVTTSRKGIISQYTGLRMAMVVVVGWWVDGWVGGWADGWSRMLSVVGKLMESRLYGDVCLFHMAWDR